MSYGTGSGELHEILEVASSAPAAWAARYPGRRFLGFFCSCWPEELVSALGGEPLRVLPPARPGSPARLPAYCCTVARGCLELGEKGTLGFLAGAGFAHACDTMQCLGDIWRYAAGMPVFYLVPPVAPLACGAEEYYTEELSALYARLAGAWGEEPREDALREAVKLHNRVRALVGRLEELRAGLPSPLVAAVLRAGQVMPRREFLRLLEEALPGLAARASRPAGRRLLAVSGAVLETDDFYRLVEELGGRVVADDTCTGYRHYAAPVEESLPPLVALARRLASRPPCPCRHLGLEARARYLLQLVRSKGAHGLVLILRKYCEPHAWDAVHVAGALRGAGVPVLVLETEGPVVGEQERTRLQAFLEQLSGGSGP
ncbi:2-hydroxyacyl-CoA dehydratase subunit D [Desulfovirgula thermocuniculi]|uniref:2-hydroxyacyl-CoA dehydratase subunit D n=1 Tax=Desulfovirgula thermocuniculi TaxID=348842 RepID=UPI0004208F33|nr:2-hydroxyacyl-CoA dehydratase family protein [Desulfovirgula thermocuniculi]